MEIPTRALSATPRPGDFGLSVSLGAKGVFIRAAQALIGDTSVYTHVFLVIDENGTILDTGPKGARLGHISEYAHKMVYYHSAYYLTDDQRDKVRTIGRSFVNTPYFYLMYLAIGLARFGWYTPKWLARLVRNSNRMICSQLVDEVLRRVGCHMFQDGRIPQNVTPGDFFWAALNLDLANPEQPGYDSATSQA